LKVLDPRQSAASVVITNHQANLRIGMTIKPFGKFGNYFLRASIPCMPKIT
jgi:hypothetical protein